MRFLYLLVVGTFFISGQGYAAIPSKNSRSNMQIETPAGKPLGRILSQPGAVIGGMAGDGFSITSISRMPMSGNQQERLIIDIGDMRGQPNKGLPAYYHAQFQQDPSRLVIDFSQMPISYITEREVQKKLSQSKFIRKVRMTMDPQDKTLSMILDLKPSAKVRVMQVKGEKTTSKVVVDLL